jgi:hypothetical protein
MRPGLRVLLTSALAAGSAPAADLPAAATAAWAGYRQWSGPVSVEAAEKWVHRVSDAGRPSQESVVEHRRMSRWRPGVGAAQFVYPGKPGDPASGTVENIRYSFNLQSARNEATVFTLRDYSDGPAAGLPGSRQALSADIMQIAFPHCYILDVPLSDIGPKGLLRPTAVEARPDGAVKVHLVGDLPAKGTGHKQTSGWVVVSPAHRWTVREYDILQEVFSASKHTYTTSTRTRFEVSPAADDIPQVSTELTVINSHNRGADRKSESTKTVQFRHGDPSTLTAADFTLTAYGLPEPVDQPSAGSTRGWVWAVAVAAVAAVVVGWWLVRRRRVTP